MSTDLIIILAVLICGFGLILYFLNRWLHQDTDPVTTQWLKSTNDALRITSSDVSRALQENSRAVNERLDNAAKVISDVQKNLGEMAEVGRGIKSLQEFLQSPKLRGGLGEEIMSQTIGQTFPKNAFHLQYSFKSGVKVDAALKTDAGLLCIDSKFPLANFTALAHGDESARKGFITDVKKHITDIASKYILPEEGTTDFSLMYIPSEAVYYEVVNTPEIMEYSRSQRVYPVSPSTFYAHLQVLLVSLQGKELESKTKEVFKLLRSIQKDYTKLDSGLNVLGRHLTNAFNQMSNVSQSFELLGQKLSHTKALDKPEEEQKSLPEV